MSSVAICSVAACRSVWVIIIINYSFLFIAAKNGVSATTVVDMKTPATRKQASRRITTSSGQKPTPLRGELSPFCFGTSVAG
jgi:hypothetical protein